MTEGILRSMLGLCCEKTYVAMTNHDGGDDDGNGDGNDNYNTASGLVSDGLIFDQITTPKSCLGLAEEDWVTMITELQTWRPVYLHVGIYLPYK